MPLSISELSHKSGVKVPTIRYYERAGLIPVPAREAGERRYEDGEADRLRFIRHGRSLGFDIGEVSALIESTTTGSCEEIATFVQFVVERMEQLEVLRVRLAEMSKSIEKGELNEASVLSLLGGLAIDFGQPEIELARQDEPATGNATGSTLKRKRSRAKHLV